MNSLTLYAIGNLAKDPEPNIKGDKQYTRLCLVSTDFAKAEEEGAPREHVTTLWLVAFGAVGEAIAKNARKGDQLFLQCRMRSNTWVKHGDKQYDYSFVVENFRFGAPGKAKREEFARAVVHDGSTAIDDRVPPRVNGEALDAASP